jgi:hypothetical protein
LCQEQRHKWRCLSLGENDPGKEPVGLWSRHGTGAAALYHSTAVTPPPSPGPQGPVTPGLNSLNILHSSLKARLKFSALNYFMAGDQRLLKKAFDNGKWDPKELAASRDDSGPRAACLSPPASPFRCPS